MAWNTEGDDSVLQLPLRPYNNVVLPDRGRRVVTPESEKNGSGSLPPPLLRPPAGFPIRLCPSPSAGMADVFGGRIVTLE